MGVYGAAGGAAKRARSPRSPTYGEPPVRPPRRGKPGWWRGPKGPDPLWAKLCVIFGVVIAVVSGSAVVLPGLVAKWATNDVMTTETLIENPATDINGPINILMLGIDPRDSDGPCKLMLSDSIIIAHIPVTHDKVFLISLGRDISELPDGSAVPIPNLDDNGFVSWKGQLLNEAFGYGASLKNTNGCSYAKDDTPQGRARGVRLAASTISSIVPGGLSWNGAAVINFAGFKKVLTAIGGVDLCVDTTVHSIHYDKNDQHNEQYLDYNAHPGRALTEGKLYQKDECRHFEPWEALDYARQRVYLADGSGDYGRQRHQQQLLMAMAKKIMNAGLGTVNDLKSAAGDMLTLRLEGAPIEDWIFTLRNIRPDDIVMVKTNVQELSGGNITQMASATNYRGQRLIPETMDLLKAIHDDTVVQFLSSHPKWITKSDSSSAGGSGSGG